jgi:hypothetical protein
MKIYLFLYFIEESALINMFKNNITHLILTIDRKGFVFRSSIEISEKLLPRIFHTFTNLIELDFNQNDIDNRTFTNLIELDFNQDDIDNRTLISLYGLSSMTCSSSSLVYLSISVQTLDDCLCLFDGRFPQLHKLCILINKIDTPSLSIENLVRIYINRKILTNMFQCYFRRQ